MRKLWLAGTIIALSGSYYYLNSKSSEQKLSAENNTQTYSLGKRAPAGDLEHLLKGNLPKSKSQNYFSPTSAAIISEQEDVAKHIALSPIDNTSNTHALAESFQNFIRPQIFSKPESAKFSPHKDTNNETTYFSNAVHPISPPQLGAPANPPANGTGPTSPVERPLTLSGHVKPLTGQISSQFPWQNTFSAWASVNCHNPMVGIYKTVDILKLGATAIVEQPLTSQTTFSFNPGPLININRPQDYTLQVTGCDLYLARILTAFDDVQNVHFSSTLLSFSQVSPVNTSPTEIPNSVFASFSEFFEKDEAKYHDVNDAFSELNSGNLANNFKHAFKGSNPEQLKYSLPIVRDIVLPAIFKEGEVSALVVDAVHWSPDYSLAVEWYINGVSTAFGPLTNWTPPGNSKREVQVSVRIGKKRELLDQVDTTYPYHQVSFKKNIINAIAPTPPLFELESALPGLASTTLLPLKIFTGVAFKNCDSFSSLAFTEEPIAPDSNQFNIICSQENIQNYTLALSATNLSDGVKKIYLWAKDDLDEISSIPHSITFYLDQTSPIIGITPPAAVYGGNTASTFSWNLTEYNSAATQNFLIEFYDGSSWIDLPYVPSTNGPLSNAPFSLTHTLPDINIDGARFRVTFADLLGHSSTSLSPSFNIRVPQLVPTPLGHDFGDVLAQSSSPNITIQFTNNGEWSSEACGIPALLGDSSQFNIVSENCSSSTLAPGNSCEVVVKATPEQKAAYNASLVLTCGTKLASATLTVTGGNNPPVLASTFTATLDEDTLLNLTLNPATDLDGDPLTYSIVTSPSHGTLLNCMAANADLTCDYLPNNNYHGTDTFVFRAFDGLNYSLPQTVTLTILPINDAPTLSGDQLASGDEDTIINITLNAGSDIENDELTYIITSLPSQGSLSCSERACFYTPNKDYNGIDSFTYKTNDGSLDSNTITVVITINPVNDSPISPADFSVNLTEDIAKSITLPPGSDIDLPAQTLTYILVTSPEHGTLDGCINSIPSTNLSCLYTPNENYNGPDSFTYKVCDPYICSLEVTTVTLNVAPANDLPEMIADQTHSLNDNQFIDFILNGATDIDIPAQILTYQIVSAPSHGTIDCIDKTSWLENTNCRFTPPANFNGTISFTYKASDGIGESLQTSTVTFQISDKTPSPSPVATLASKYYTNNTNITLTNSSCSDINSLYVSTNSTTPSFDDVGWISCNTTSGGVAGTLSPVNGLHTVYIWSKDQFDNVQDAPATVEVVFDNIPPSINIASENVMGNTLAKVSFSISELNSTATEDIKLRYYDGSTWTSWTTSGINGPLFNYPLTADIAVPNSDNTELIFEITYKDLADNEAVVSKTFYSDITLPIVDFLSINGGSLTASNNNIQVALEAHDQTSKVRYFCVKYNDSNPPSDDSNCWKNVSAPSPGIPAAKNIVFSGYYFQVGFIKATYTIYAWVKDEAGLISINSNTLNVDRYEIDYDPGSPPKLLAIEATKSDLPNRPQTPSDLTSLAGTDVYVKWRAEDAEGFAVNPISLAYTFNDVDFLPFNGSSALVNGANGSCTVDADFTGCAVVTSPSSTYFKVRVIAKDDANTTTYLNSEPLNSSKLKIIAGNTEHGLGGSAASAVYYPHGSAKQVAYLSKHKLAVSEDGKFFYIDPQRGLLWISPATGTLDVFIKTTGTSNGDGGNISSATLTHPSAITMDAYNHLLIWDNDRIRRVNLETMKINNVLGGGNQFLPIATVPAGQIQLGGFNRTWSTLIPLPNGDIIFSPQHDQINLQRYRALDQKVEPMVLTGQGIEGHPSQNWAEVQSIDFGAEYDTATSQIRFMAKSFHKSYVGDAYTHYVRILPIGNESTPYPSTAPYDLGFNTKTVTSALDGKIYLSDRFRTRIWLYDSLTNTQTPVLGTGDIGTSPCAENTPATSCPVDVDSFFVSKNGRVYFMDSGTVRTIDDNQQVITLFGEFPSYGNGQLATIARFGNIIDLKLGKHSTENNYVIISDGFSNEYREFKIDGSITGLGGNGFGWAGPWRFESDPATGDIFAPRNGVLQRLIRTTNVWTTIVGGGGSHYPNADGLSGPEIYFGGYPGHTSGLVDNKLYYKTHHWVGYDNGCMIKGYDVTDSYRQSHFMGTNTYCSENYALGENIADYFLNVANILSFKDPRDGAKKLFFNREGWSDIWTLNSANELETFLSLPRAFSSFTYKEDVIDGLNIFYCNGGKLYKYHYDSGIETHLSWPSETLYCKGVKTILFNAERNSIIFPFTQNGLDGVAEYSL